VPGYFFLSVFCSFASMFFKLLGLRLFIPLLRGIISGNFSNVHDKAGIERFLVAKFPEVFNSSASIFFLLLGMILTAVVVNNMLNYFAVLCVGQEIRRADANIRKLIMTRYLSFGKLHFDRAHAATVSHIILNSANGVVGQLAPLQKMLSQILSLAAYLSIMFWISWQLTLAAIVIFPLFQYSTEWLVRQIQGVTRAHEVLQINLLQRINNLISCIPLVKIYASEEKEKRALFDESDEEIKLAFQMQKKQQLVRPIQEICTMVSLLTMVMIMMMLMPKEGARTVSHYLVFFYLMRMALPNFGVFAAFRMSLVSAEAQITRVRDILLNDDGKFIVRSGPREFGGLKEKIEFRSLTFFYRERHAVLRDLSFEVEKGKMTAIVGPTGAGKTTLVHLLARLYDCPSGMIFVDGIDIREFTLKSLMGRMALVSQDPMLFNDTLKENIAYGLNGEVTDERLALAVKKARLDDFLAKLPEGLQTKIGDRGVQLSGGEKQRVSIARAFLKEAEILILDEATSALDTITERSIQQAIDDSAQGRTILVIAHRLSTILNADKIVVLEAGRVAEQGTLNELMEKKGKFYEYWSAQRTRQSNFLENLQSVSIT